MLAEGASLRSKNEEAEHLSKLEEEAGTCKAYFSRLDCSCSFFSDVQVFSLLFKFVAGCKNNFVCSGAKEGQQVGSFLRVLFVKGGVNPFNI